MLGFTQHRRLTPDPRRPGHARTVHQFALPIRRSRLGAWWAAHRAVHAQKTLQDYLQWRLAHYQRRAPQQAPLNAAPRIWIQPPIPAVKRDGTFSGMVYLGTEKVGAGEKYNILVFSCQNKQRFREGEVLMGLPDDCVVSDPVTVLRTK